MNDPRLPSLLLAAVLLVAGCATLEPKLPVADATIAAEWPIPAATAATTAAADIGWGDFFHDPKLKELVARALENNRDLRVAILNVERARAQYRIQRAERLPAVGASGSLARSGGDAVPTTDAYRAELGVTQFELDLFGRVRSLSEAAVQQYFASEEARRSAQLTLIAEIANTYLTLAADQELERISRETLENQEAAFKLTEERHRLGGVSGLDVSQARTTVESARADAARYAGQVARDTNALTLLVGRPIEAGLLPTTFAPQVSGLDPLPAGLPSEVLLRRPDVRQSEHQLRAANANIGAARAAFFPSISLTAAAGVASNDFSSLFSGGNAVWSFVPRINVPIFQGGQLRAGLDVATADRDIALARYEKAIQTGFSEVADALALSRNLGDQLQAQEALLAAASRAFDLSKARYDAGQVSYIVLLDAQRSQYAARQALVSTQLSLQANRIALYKALGGGWRKGSVPNP